MLIRKSMENTSTPAVNGHSQCLDDPSQHVNGPSRRLVSQEQQAAEIYSDQLRAPESQLSPYIPDIPSEERTVLSHSWRSTANPHFPASDIDIPIAPLTKSNTLSGEERIIFENAANMVRYHTWFVNPFVKPAENNSLLEDYWVTTARKQVWGEVELERAAMTFVSRLIEKERPIGHWSKLIDTFSWNRGSQVLGHTLFPTPRIRSRTFMTSRIEYRPK